MFLPDKTISVLMEFYFTLPLSIISNIKKPDQTKQTLANLVTHLENIILAVRTYLAFYTEMYGVYIEFNFDESSFDDMVD